MPGDVNTAAKVASTGPKKGSLLAIVGMASATALLTLIPSEESGRKVAVAIAPSGQATITHLSGPQYLRAYLDAVGVATACDGLTGKDIKLASRFTEAQCSIMLEARLAETASHVMACTPGLALTVPRRDNLRTAMVSLAYNVGWPAYCRSSIPAKVNTGRIRAACDTLPDFNKAGGRMLAGLTTRRGRERTLCLRDAA
jgi:lysozyme